MLLCTENCREISNVQEVDIKDEVSATNTDSFSSMCTSQSTTRLSSCSDHVSVDSSRPSAYVGCPECGIILRRGNFTRHWRVHRTHASQFTRTSAIPVTVVNQRQAYPRPGSRTSVHVACPQCGIVIIRTNFARHWRAHQTQAFKLTGASTSRGVSPYIPRAVGATSSATYQATSFIHPTPRDEDQTNRPYPETVIRVSTVQETTSPVETPEERRR